VFGNVTNSGIVSPGDSPGTLTIIGNYTQTSSGTLKTEIGGLNAGVNSDLLQVNGAGGSSLDGTLQLIRINSFKPLRGDRVNIINDPSGHTGMFSTLDYVNWGLIRPVPMYNEPTDIYVVFELTPFSSLSGLTRNQRSVAHELDEVSTDSREDALITFLGHEPPSSLPHDFDLIAPEELASIYEIGFSQAVVQNMNLMHRMDDIRAGSTGYSGPVVETSTAKDEAPISDKNVATKNPVPAFVPCPENRWGVFALGSGDFVNVGNDDDNAHGYALNNGSMLVGVDYRIGNHIAIGIDGEYANDIAELVDRGRVYVDGGKIGGFATAYGKGWFGSQIYVDVAGGGGWNSYDTKRIGLQNEVVQGSTDGAEYNAMLAYGADWMFGNLTLGTWSSLQYTDVQFNHFTERGSLAPLEFPDQDEDSFRSSSGARVSYNLKFGPCGFIRPEVRAAWQHEYNDRAYPIDSRLASGAGDIFRVWGPTVGRDAALIDAGVTVQFSARFAASAFYDGVIGRTNYASHAVSGGIRISF
jgi:outer membrane autotransporter protein